MSAIQPSRANDFAAWYQEVIKPLVMNSPVRGCMIIKPLGQALWEGMQKHLDQGFKDLGIENIYCPLLIPMSFLQKEAEHIEGFAKECAVVTHHRLRMDEHGAMVPDAPLSEPYIIRPTSETMMGHAFSQWVQSYRDLPLKVNQWANVMRWEMRPRLLLRTSEFLWQEGHTVHAESDEAEAMARTMIDYYQTFLESVLAIPVIQGRKTLHERFAGAETTWTVEAIMQDGKAVQAGTSHALGQHFSKACDIRFSDQNGLSQHAWTTSWGVSTRMIGALVMTHGDDDGLVLPPRISPHHVVLIPVIQRASDQEPILEHLEQIQQALQACTLWQAPLRVHIDRRPLHFSDKKWDWIKKGIPIRIEIGMRELKNASLRVFRRDRLSSPQELSWPLNAEEIKSLLLDIQHQLWQRAYDRLKACEIITTEEAWSDFIASGQARYALVPWAEEAAAEEALHVHQWSIRCLIDESHPHAPAALADHRCIATGKQASAWALVAKAY